VAELSKSAINQRVFSPLVFADFLFFEQRQLDWLSLICVGNDQEVFLIDLCDKYDNGAIAGRF
jgi:hypothetical protein